MVDTPTSEYGLRQQELGTNTNTWGDDKLNEVIRAAAQIMGGVKTITMTGDYTLTSTNYVTTADNKNRVFVLSGTLTAASNLIVPSSDCVYAIYNGTTGGFAVTAKTSAGTGISIPNGRLAWVYCDSVNVSNAAATTGGVASPTAASLDIPAWSAVETAIAAASGLAAPFILVSGTDTTPGYLGQKLDASAAGAITMTWTVTNPSGDEGIQPVPVLDTTQVAEFIALTGTITATNTSGTAAMTNRRRYRITGGTLTLPTFAAGSFNIVELDPAAGTTVTIGRNSQTIDGAAEDDTFIGDGGAGVVVLYKYSSAGAVTSEIIGSVP